LKKFIEPGGENEGTKEEPAAEATAIQEPVAAE